MRKWIKLNYKAGEKAIIELIAPPSSTISLLIVDPSDKPTSLQIQLLLGPDGKKNYELDLADYGSGVYTVVLTRGNAQTSEEFFQLDYKQVQVKLKLVQQRSLFTWRSNFGFRKFWIQYICIIIDLTLYDPDGNEVKKKKLSQTKKVLFLKVHLEFHQMQKLGFGKLMQKVVLILKM